MNKPEWINLNDEIAQLNQKINDLAEDFAEDLTQGKEERLDTAILSTFFHDLLQAHPQMTLERLAELCFNAVNEWDK